MDKIHPIWELMRPTENEKYEDFKFEEYYKRIVTHNMLNHIPKTIFEQWIYYHHQEYNTLKNYAWINYENIEFIICDWSLRELERINVIDNFRDYYSDKASYSDFNQFGCTPNDLKSWKEKGTWRVPPIILDIASIRCNIPSWSKLTPPYQLVEGHTRFGYLHSLKTISDLKKGGIASKHLIYLMKNK
jgi:hypothetical protein